METIILSFTSLSNHFQVAVAIIVIVIVIVIVIIIIKFFFTLEMPSFL